VLSSYSVVLAAYFVVALTLVVQLARRKGVDTRVIVESFLVGVPAGIIGARLLDVVEYSNRYASLTDILGRRGSSIYGGLLLNFAATAIYCRFRGVAPIKLLDLGAPAMALGEAMSRVGCFLNGCCYGVGWSGPLAVRFSAGSFALADQQARGLVGADAVATLPVHPVQLYSAVAMLIAAVFLAYRYLTSLRDGETFYWFLVTYGALRLVVAPLRVERLPSMFLFSIAFITVGAGALQRLATQNRLRHA
jgi:phosphatidylglycerol:prolipoprotein diacylglycerol transferase